MNFVTELHTFNRLSLCTVVEDNAWIAGRIGETKFHVICFFLKYCNSKVQTGHENS